MKVVEIKRLKARLSEYVRLAKAGETGKTPTSIPRQDRDQGRRSATTTVTSGLDSGATRPDWAITSQRA